MQTLQAQSPRAQPARPDNWYTDVPARKAGNQRAEFPCFKPILSKNLQASI